MARWFEINPQSDWNSISGANVVLNKPTVPTNTNQLTNGAGFLTSASAGVTMLLASATNVSGAALASTALTYISGMALSSHTPIFAIIKYRSGTSGIGVVRIKTTSVYMVGVTPILTLTSTDNNLIINLTGVATNSGNISVEVTTISLTASSFDVYVYGIAKP